MNKNINLMKNIKIQNLIEELRAANDALLIPDHEQETVLEFSATPYAEVGFEKFTEEQRINKEYGLYLNITTEDDEDDLYNARFLIFAELEELLTRYYAETYNDDCCSFKYEYVHRAENESTEFIITCTDYLA